LSDRFKNFTILKKRVKTGKISTSELHGHYTNISMVANKLYSDNDYFTADYCFFLLDNPTKKAVKQKTSDIQFERNAGSLLQGYCQT